MEPINRRGKALFGAIGQALSDGTEPHRLARHRQQFIVHVAQQSKQNRGPQRSWWLAAATALLVAAGVLMVYEFQPKNDTSLGFHVNGSDRNGRIGHWVDAPAEKSVPIQFEGGTRLSLASGGIARIDEASDEKVSVELRLGKIVADVAKKSGRRWTITAGPYTVVVLGTRFTVSWDPSANVFDLDVERGVVLVHGQGLNKNGVKVAKGHTLLAKAGVVSVDSSEALAEDNKIEKEVNEDGVAGEREAAVSDCASQVLSQPPKKGQKKQRRNINRATSWLQYYEQQAFERAFEAARDEGLAKLKMRLDATSLWRLMETARRVGEIDEALSMLKTHRDRFSKSEKAQIIPFLIGKILSDKKGEPAAAARWFAVYLEEAPNGPLREDALRRLVTVNEEMERWEVAKQYAREYLYLNDQGPFAAHCQIIVNGN
jgi:hypothetical protein